MSIQGDIIDAVIGNALEVFNITYKQLTADDFDWDDFQKEITDLLTTGTVLDYIQSKFGEHIKEFITKIEEHFVHLANEFETNVLHISKHVAQETANTLKIALGADGIGLPTKDYYKSVASNLLIQGTPQKDWWEAQSDDFKFKFTAQLRQGLINGETNQQLIDRIVGNGTTPGIINTARRNAATLVQTGVQSVAADARRATYQANSDVIAGIMQVSTLDSHTSDICVAYSGQQWNLDYEPINGSELAYNGGVPRHWNCRSVEIPVTKTFAELGLNIPEVKGGSRASSELAGTGPIPMNTTFEDFLNRKGVAFQDKMLGTGRAQLWRDGKITLRDLINGQGHSISIAELRNNIEKNDIAELFDKISKPDGGFTYQPESYNQPTEGYAVSPFPENSFAIDMKDFTAKDLIDYIITNKKLFKSKDTYLGAWHDPETDKIFLDISVVKDNEQDAETLALKHDQIAYFDLKKGASVDVNRAATSGGVTK
jgi:hypothetical protein